MNHMDMTRLALMKMIGGTSLPLQTNNLDPGDKIQRMNGEDEDSDNEEDRVVRPHSDLKEQENGLKGASSVGEKSLVVSLELNSVTYQGVLFAQPLDLHRKENLSL